MLKKIVLAGGLGAAVLLGGALFLAVGRDAQLPTEKTQTQKTGPENAEAPDLFGRLLSPLVDSSGAILADPLSQVELTYLLENRGTTAIGGLHGGSTCSCQLPMPMPATILPGESAQVTVRFRAAEVGQRDSVFPILAGDSDAPLLVLRTPIRVNLAPPRILQAPESVRMQVVKGTDPQFTVLILTLEKKGDAPGIERLVPGIDEISAELAEVGDAPASEDGVVMRRYVFRLTVAERGFAAGRHTRTTIRIAARAGNQALERTILADLALEDALAVVPNQKTIRVEPGELPPALRVTVVRRDNQEGAIVASGYDSELLDVRPVSQANQKNSTFEITLRGPVAQTHTTTVLFTPDGDKSRQVEFPVTIVSGSPEG